MRRRRILMWVASFLLVIGCIVGAIIIDDMTVELEKVDFYSDVLPGSFYGYRILLIADFHDSFFADQIAKIIAQEKPDMVLFLGDMTELAHSSMTGIEKLLDAIPQEQLVYGILGNHETQSPEVRTITQSLEIHGLKLLNNEKITLTRDGANIDLIGVRDVTDDDNSLEGSWFLEQMRVYLQTVIDPTRFTLLACHRANLYPYLSDIPATLMLSGHIHGGIIRLPFLGGIYDVDGTFLPDYDKGFYSEGKMKMFVSVGCNFNLRKPRVFNGPTVTLLTLKN